MTGAKQHFSILCPDEDYPFPPLSDYTLATHPDYILIRWPSASGAIILTLHDKMDWNKRGFHLYINFSA